MGLQAKIVKHVLAVSLGDEKRKKNDKKQAQIFKYDIKMSIALFMQHNTLLQQFKHPALCYLDAELTLQPWARQTKKYKNTL